ncbi:MAG: OprO/OprP family phosphate-selective porin [Thermoanaerobaculales bacterium]|nr:OprO/OprP family phosphate-selective porin [Thermoanaerobaculales bacterium]
MKRSIWKLILIGVIATSPLAARADSPDDVQLADDDTSASLQQDELTAGYDKGFFIGTQDNAFHLRINPEFQIRLLYNTRDNEPGRVGEDNHGFQLRRARLDFRGHAFDPKLTYRLRVNADRSDGDVYLELAYFGYQVANDWNVKIGQIKPLFVREENVKAFRQLAVERSYAADYFTIDFTQGAELTYDGDQGWRASLAVHDGSYAANTEFNADRTDFAVAGRAEFRPAGDWKQFADFSSWSSDDFGLLLGVAGDFEAGEKRSGTSTPDLYKFTADISAEFGGANLFVAGYLRKFSDNNDPTLPSNLDDATQLGLVAQGGVFVIPDTFELFGRYEWIDFDGVYYRNSGAGTQGGTGDLAGDDHIIVTIGGNWFFKKHNAKLTVDLVWALDPLPVSNTGGGLLSNSEDDQFAIRAQWQFAF